jgi:hypothetical protein
MKKYTQPIAWRSVARLTTWLLLACSFSAQATAPRITAELFGDAKKADIVAYQGASAAAKVETELALAIVTEAFKAAGKTPVIDVLPSQQLATYALFNNEAQAMMGIAQDLAGQDKKKYSVVAFHLKGADDVPVVLIFSNVHGKELQKAFVSGMQKILKSGKYLQQVEKSRGKLPADYVDRVQRLNPSWK